MGAFAIPQAAEIGIATDETVQTIVTTAETAVLTSGLIVVTTPTPRVLIHGFFYGSTAAGASTVESRIRRGNGLSGAMVAKAAFEQIGASVSYQGSIIVIDEQVGVANVEYTLTLEHNFASANGNCQLAIMRVEIL